MNKEKCQGCKKLLDLENFSVKSDGTRYMRCMKCSEKAKKEMKRKREEKLLSRKKIENNIKITHPWLIREWDFHKNIVNIETISYGCGLKVWWLCNLRKHSYEASVYHRTGEKPRGCPYCAGKKVCEDNCLATTHPKLIKEWDYNKNKIKPTEITYGSDKKVWWICKKGHSFEMAISNRTCKSSNCPYCCNKKVCEDNCLATTHPKLIKEWDYNKNKIKPTEITYGSGKKVWWICDKGHHYICSVLNRTNSCGCPFCNQSKGEKRIEIFLKNTDFPYECQKKFIYMFGLSKLKFVYDFLVVINDIKILIEFDGGQHFEEIEFFHREKSFKKQQLNDLLKTSYAHQNNFCILRICYKDIDKIEGILEDFIARIKNENRRIHKMNKKYYQNHIDLIRGDLAIIPI